MLILEVVKESAYLKDGPPIMRHYSVPNTSEDTMPKLRGRWPSGSYDTLSAASTSPPRRQSRKVGLVSGRSISMPHLESQLMICIV